MNNEKKNYKDDLKGYAICFAAAVLTIVIFCIYFYNMFIKFQINYMQQYNKNIISKAHDFQNDLMMVSNSFFKDKNVNIFLNNDSEIDNASATKAIATLCDSSTISPMLKNVVIKNLSNNMVYSTFSEKKENIDAFKMKYPEYSDFLDTSPTGFNAYLCQTQTENTVIYSYNDYKGHIIYAFVDSYNLKGHFFNNVYPIECDTLLTDRDYLIASNASDENSVIFNEIKNKNSKSVQFKENSIIIKTVSKKYTVISTVKLSLLFKKAISTGSFLILFAIMIFILISFITYYFHFKQKKFIAEHLKLINKHIDTSVENIINKLFNYDIINTADEIALNEYFQINNGNYFLPIVIKITNYAELAKDVGNDDITVYRYGFVNIITEVAESISELKTANIGRELIGVLLYSEDPFDLKIVKAKVEYFENTIQKYFCADLFSVIGKEAEDIISVYEQIPTLINAQNYKFINNENKLVISEIDSKCHQPEYPLHIQVAITAAINSKNIEAFNDGIQKFADYIIKVNSLNGKEWFLKLFLAISDNCQKNPNISINHNTLETMLNCDKIGEIVDLLSNSIKYLNTSSPEIDAEVAENFDKIVKKAIEEEFSNPNFCIQTITERFGFTASYFGKKFKHNFDVSFNKYLLDYRLNSALELLVKTDYTNTKIAQMCGFNSERYFMTIFKKNFGISPKAYKSTYLNKQQKPKKETE